MIQLSNSQFLKISNNYLESFLHFPPKIKSTLLELQQLKKMKRILFYNNVIRIVLYLKIGVSFEIYFFVLEIIVK